MTTVILRVGVHTIYVHTHHTRPVGVPAHRYRTPPPDSLPAAAASAAAAAVCIHGSPARIVDWVTAAAPLFMPTRFDRGRWGFGRQNDVVSAILIFFLSTMGGATGGCEGEIAPLTFGTREVQGVQ